jgi:hypothetical protein
LNERLKDNQLFGSMIVLLGLAVSFISIDKRHKTHALNASK